jgi:hypothetical protein
MSFEPVPRESPGRDNSPRQSHRTLLRNPPLANIIFDVLGWCDRELVESVLDPVYEEILAGRHGVGHCLRQAGPSVLAALEKRWKKGFARIVRIVRPVYLALLLTKDKILPVQFILRGSISACLFTQSAARR